jgi:cyclohexanecarboxylate-CoA ligase
VTILDDLDRHARERPAERAVVEIGADGRVRELTWDALASETDRVAGTLSSLGLGNGDTVAFQLPNQINFVTIALATLRLGAVCEPLMPIFRERELSFMLRESGARVLFVPSAFRGRDYAAMANGLRSDLPALEHVVVVDGDVPSGGAAPSGPGPRPDQIAQLLFTSGTSGEPKGALHRHDALMRAADHHIDHFGLSGDDVIYVPSPLAHQTGFLYGMWIAIRLGAPQVLQEVWDAEVGLDAMRRFGVTFVQAATPFLADLTQVAEERDQTPEQLRTFVATGASIPRELARRSREVLDAEVGGAWGTTESCLGCAFAPGDAAERAWGTDGRGADARSRRGGQLRGPHRLPVRGVSQSPGPDRGGSHRGPVVSHRRSRPDRLEWLRPHHRPGQGRDQPRRREGPRRRDRAAPACPSVGARRRDRRDAR